MSKPPTKQGTSGRPRRTEFDIYYEFTDGMENLTSPFVSLVNQASGSIRMPMRTLYNIALGKDLGTMEKARGHSLKGTQITAGKDILGGFQFQPSNTSKWKLLTVEDGATNTATVNYFGASDWVADDLNNLTTGADCFFAEYLDRVFLVNHNTMQSWDGDTGNDWDTTNCDTTNFGQYIAPYKQRLFHANTASNPWRIYWSSLPSSGTITWTASDATDTLNFKEITGLAVLPRADVLLVFTPVNFYRSAFQNADVGLQMADAYQQGTRSPRSIIVTEERCFWYNQHGIWMYIVGQAPQLISRPIQKVIEGISASNYSEVTACLVSNFGIRWYVGDITISELGEEDVNISDAYIQFYYKDNVWVIGSSNETAKVCFNGEDNNAKQKAYLGNDDGEIFEIDKEDIYNQAGNDYACEITTPWILGADDSHGDIFKQLNFVKVYTTQPGLRMIMKMDHYDWGQNPNSRGTERYEWLLDGNVINLIEMPRETLCWRFKISFVDNSKNIIPGIQKLRVNYSLRADWQPQDWRRM